MCGVLYCTNDIGTLLIREDTFWWNLIWNKKINPKLLSRWRGVIVSVTELCHVYGKWRGTVVFWTVYMVISLDLCSWRGIRSCFLGPLWAWAVACLLLTYIWYCFIVPPFYPFSPGALPTLRTANQIVFWLTDGCHCMQATLNFSKRKRDYDFKNLSHLCKMMNIWTNHVHL